MMMMQSAGMSVTGGEIISLDVRVEAGIPVVPAVDAGRTIVAAQRRVGREAAATVAATTATPPPQAKAIPGVAARSIAARGTVSVLRVMSCLRTMSLPSERSS